MRGLTDSQGRQIYPAIVALLACRQNHPSRIVFALFTGPGPAPLHRRGGHAPASSFVLDRHLTSLVPLVLAFTIVTVLACRPAYNFDPYMSAWMGVVLVFTVLYHPCAWTSVVHCLVVLPLGFARLLIDHCVYFSPSMATMCFTPL